MDEKRKVHEPIKTKWKKKGLMVNKKIIHFKICAVILFAAVVCCVSVFLSAETGFSVFSISEIEGIVQKLMEKGNIPGLSLVIL